MRGKFIIYGPWLFSKCTFATTTTTKAERKSSHEFRANEAASNQAGSQ